MIKDKIISLKIRSEQYNKCKDLDIKLIDVWERGFEEILTNDKQFLENLVEKSYKKYIRVYTKLQNFDKIKNESIAEMEQLKKIYIKQGRNIDNPTKEDKSWISARISKIEGITNKEFLLYLKEDRK